MAGIRGNVENDAYEGAQSPLDVISAFFNIYEDMCKEHPKFAAVSGIAMISVFALDLSWTYLGGNYLYGRITGDIKKPTYSFTEKVESDVNAYIDGNREAEEWHNSSVGNVPEDDLYSKLISSGAERFLSDSEITNRNAIKHAEEPTYISMGKIKEAIGKGVSSFVVGEDELRPKVFSYNNLLDSNRSDCVSTTMIDYRRVSLD